uniref:Uncharacterized protein n=2 Tax=Micrurus TaxID=8634 RepID=A0A2D4GSY3_MICCO
MSRLYAIMSCKFLFSCCKYGNATLVRSAIILMPCVILKLISNIDNLARERKKTHMELIVINKYHLVFKTNSVLLKHKLQSNISAPFSFFASFPEYFTAIFNAYGEKINMDISAMKSSSLFILLYFSCLLLKIKTVVNAHCEL